MANLAVKVAPTSRIAIRAFAMRVRSILKVESDYFPSQNFDLLLSNHFPDYIFDVLEPELMGDDHGLTEPDQRLIFIRRDVYDGAMCGVGRDRFTFAHELGHLLLHEGNYLARSDPQAERRTHAKYEDSEWQADNFAAELLMPIDAVRKCVSPIELAQRCGVSVAAARVRFEILLGEGLI